MSWHPDHFSHSCTTSTGSVLNVYRTPSGEQTIRVVGTKIWHGRLSFDDALWTVTFDGKAFKIPPRAYKIFKLICNGDGIVGSKEIRDEVGGDEKTQFGHILDNNLPRELRDLIKGQRGNGSGFYLELPPKDPTQ